MLNGIFRSAENVIANPLLRSNTANTQQNQQIKNVHVHGHLSDVVILQVHVYILIKSTTCMYRLLFKQCAQLVCGDRKFVTTLGS